MATEVIVPEVGEIGMEVTFVRWLKAVGEDVVEGEPLFEVDTEKTTVEIEALIGGRLAEAHVTDGAVVQPHQVIGLLLSPGEQAPSSPAHSARPAGAQSQGPPQFEGEGASPRPQSRADASPRARRLARERGVDLASIAGSGPQGLITERDVERAGPQRSTKVRHAVGARTSQSWQTIPHFYLRLDADVTEGLKLAKPTALITAAVAHAVARHPECNLAWHDGEVVGRDTVDIGLLVDTAEGLLLPSIRGADHLRLAGMQAAIEAAAERARQGGLRPEDYGERSISISNLGMFAVDQFNGVIAPPDVMLLTIGRTRTSPRWNASAMTWEPRRVVSLTLSIDHRALDGAQGGRLLSTLEHILASPGELA